ncbi:MAG: type II toxin-antitoxin system RelE/ParE family toxin [Dehalococcoidia bacterium]|nr:type II toxin-antitoxin system RelE/ParE family toxin [Dehalococcoidia bacterium]
MDATRDLAEVLSDAEEISPRHRNELASEVDVAVLRLADFPFSAPVAGGRDLELLHIRQLTVRHLLIFYAVDDPEVVLLAVVPAARMQ